jgi:hypothetical protein
MSKVEELEHAIEQLPVEDFEQLSAWIDSRRAALGDRAGKTVPFRDHRAFLNSYSPEDEGLYDNGQGR